MRSLQPPSGARASHGDLREGAYRRSAVKLPRRRRSRVLKLARPFFTAAILVGLPAAAAGWVLTSPHFALEAVVVEGTERVPQEWVSQELSHLVGRNLVRLSLETVPKAVSAHPWVEGVEVSKELPRRLRVRVLERRPAALVVAGEGLSYAERSGRIIAPLDGSGPLGAAAALPLVEGAGPWSVEVPLALEVVEEIGHLRPAWVGELEKVEVLSEEDFRLRTRALPFVLLVASQDDELGAKIRYLESLLPRLKEQYGELAAVDLRIPRRIVVEPGQALALAATQEVFDER